jgi:hypothetical protein
MRQNENETNGDYAERIMKELNVPEGRESYVKESIVFMLSNRTMIDDIERNLYSVKKSGRSFIWSRK